MSTANLYKKGLNLVKQIPLFCSISLIKLLHQKGFDITKLNKKNEYVCFPQTKTHKSLQHKEEKKVRKLHAEKNSCIYIEL